MAIDLCPPNSLLLSSSDRSGCPRLSFSDGDDDRDGPRLDASLLPDSPPPADFRFCVPGSSFDREPSSSADELFCEGKLLPIPIPPAIPPVWAAPYRLPTATVSPAAAGAAHGDERRQRLKELIAREKYDDDNDGAKEEEKRSSPARTSFWRFRRSNSLNVTTTSSSTAAAGGQKGASGGLIRSSPVLPRSKSTGSHSNPKHHRRRESGGGNADRGVRLARTGSCSSTTSGLKRSASVSSSTPTSYYYGCHDWYGNAGVRISPVLNVPTPCVLPRSGSVNSFFGFGHLLCNGKDKKGRKKSLFSRRPP